MLAPSPHCVLALNRHKSQNWNWEETIHLWAADLDLAGAHLPRLYESLCPQERERARNFLQERDRRRFIAARGLLRAILGSCIGVRGAQISIEAHPTGKPFLPQHRSWRFNVSHSQNFALWAVAREREVGVDIERLRLNLNLDALTNRLFSAPEKAWLRSKTSTHAAFFRLWTLKEAYLKADGRGIFLPLQEIDVSSETGRPAHRDARSDRWRFLEQWRLQSLSVFPECVAAVAAEGQNWKLEFHRAAFHDIGPPIE